MAAAERASDCGDYALAVGTKTQKKKEKGRAKARR